MPDLPRAAIEIVAPPDARPAAGVAPPAGELRGVLIAACTSAAGGLAECVEDPTAKGAAAVVVVSFRGTEAAHVEVGARRGDAPFGARDLSFLSSDARVERYRTVGYSAGTLVAEYLADVAERERTALATKVAGSGNAAANAGGSSPEGAPAATKDAEKKGVEGAAATKAEEPEPKDAEPEAPEAPRDPARAYIDVGVVHGTAFEEGGARTGGAARGVWLFDRVMATAAFSYSVRSKRDEEPSASFLMASAGVGYFVPISMFEMGVRGEAVLERLTSEGEAASGKTGSAARFLGAARVGADVAWLPVPSLGVVAAGDVLLRAAPTELLVVGETVATVPVVDYSLTAGLRLSFR
jgi:hypothetical protein